MQRNNPATATAQQPQQPATATATAQQPVTYTSQQQAAAWTGYYMLCAQQASQYMQPTGGAMKLTSNKRSAQSVPSPIDHGMTYRLLQQAFRWLATLLCMTIAAGVAFMLASQSNDTVLLWGLIIMLALLASVICVAVYIAILARAVIKH